MEYIIDYGARGKKTVDSLDEAHEILSAEYPDVCYCDSGDAWPTPIEREIESAGRILVWANESDSENDAGDNAVAEIYRADR